VAGSTPDWFSLGEEATPEVMRRIATVTSAVPMSLQVQMSPKLAHWFMLDSLLLANQANREGMHANALSLTRQCLEALTVVELGICGHKGSEAILLKWDRDEITPGKLRAWLEQHVWPKYGSGLWSEPWTTFMREFAGALQPYAHYGSKLAQWQVRLLPGVGRKQSAAEATTALIEVRPRAYDAQKATRITLFHGILTYALGRIWIANNKTDSDFAALIKRLGIALGKSRYLDGHATDWGQQFWAMMWQSDGDTVLE
jgi:hypothetical protein